MPRQIFILNSVLKVVVAAPAEVRHEFWHAHQRLEEAKDPRSWDELATLPAKDPDVLPKDSWIMPFTENGGWLMYVIGDDGVKIVGVALPASVSPKARHAEHG